MARFDGELTQGGEVDRRLRSRFDLLVLNFLSYLVVIVRRQLVYPWTSILASSFTQSMAV